MSTTYIAWGYPKGWNLPLALPVKLGIGSLADCRRARESYGDQWQILVVRKGTDWQNTSLSDHMAKMREGMVAA